MTTFASRLVDRVATTIITEGLGIVARLLAPSTPAHIVPAQRAAVDTPLPPGTVIRLADIPADMVEELRTSGIQPYDWHALVEARQELADDTGTAAVIDAWAEGAR